MLNTLQLEHSPFAIHEVRRRGRPLCNLPSALSYGLFLDAMQTAIVEKWSFPELLWTRKLDAEGNSTFPIGFSKNRLYEKAAAGTSFDTDNFYYPLLVCVQQTPVCATVLRLESCCAVTAAALSLAFLFCWQWGISYDCNNLSWSLSSNWHSLWSNRICTYYHQGRFCPSLQWVAFLWDNSSYVAVSLSFVSPLS